MWRRSASAQIDGGVILALTCVGIIAVVFTVRSAAEIGRVPERAVLSMAIVASLITWVVLSGAYHIAFVGARGQTVGHRAMGIRVVQVAGGDMGYGRAAARWAGIVLANLTFGVGYLPILLTPTRRGLHDFLAGSIVVEA